MPNLPRLTFKRSAFLDPSDPRRPITPERRIREWGRLSVEWDEIVTTYVEGWGEGVDPLVESVRLASPESRARSRSELQRIRVVSVTYREEALRRLDECELILWQVSNRWIEARKIQRQEIVESMAAAIHAIDAAIEVVEAADLVRPYLQNGRLMGPGDGHGPRFIRAMTTMNEAIMAQKRVMAAIEARTVLLGLGVHNESRERLEESR